MADTIEGDGVRCRLEGAVAIVTLSRPERHNAFDGVMLDALGQALSRLEAEEACRVVLIRGEGPSFCAGWDTSAFSQMAALGEDALGAAFARNAAVTDQISSSDRIVVTAVHGACMGFGVGLVARSDISLAASSARFAMPELSHGVVPGMVLGDALECLGRRIAMDWVFSRDVWSAEQARANGLVQRTCADEDLEAELQSLCARLASLAPHAVAATKTLARSYDNDAAYETRAIAASAASILSLSNRN